MANEKELKLVDGIFNIEDAEDILSHLFDKKINFHYCRIFSLEEKFGIKDNYSVKRIEALKAAKTEMLEIVDRAKMAGKNIEIHANIQVCFTSKETTSSKHTEMAQVQ